MAASAAATAAASALTPIVHLDQPIVTIPHWTIILGEPFDDGRYVLAKSQVGSDTQLVVIDLFHGNTIQFWPKNCVSAAYDPQFINPFTMNCALPLSSSLVVRDRTRYGPGGESSIQLLHLDYSTSQYELIDELSLVPYVSTHHITYMRFETFVRSVGDSPNQGNERLIAVFLMLHDSELEPSSRYVFAVFTARHHQLVVRTRPRYIECMMFQPVAIDAGRRLLGTIKLAYDQPTKVVVLDVNTGEQRLLPKDADSTIIMLADGLKRTQNSTVAWHRNYLAYTLSDGSAGAENLMIRMNSSYQPLHHKTLSVNVCLPVDARLVGICALDEHSILIQTRLNDEHWTCQLYRLSLRSPDSLLHTQLAQLRQQSPEFCVHTFAKLPPHHILRPRWPTAP